MMSPEKKTLFNQIAEIIATTLHIAKSRVTLNATMHDLGADSLSMVEIILKLEEQFNIEIDDEKAEHLTNVQEVLNYISSLKGL
jgi:acyl carrier protein